MFTYQLYTHDDGQGFDVELSDYPNKMVVCLHCILTFYLTHNEVIDTQFTTDKFITPDDVSVIDGTVYIQGTPIYNG